MAEKLGVLLLVSWIADTTHLDVGRVNEVVEVLYRLGFGSLIHGSLGELAVVNDLLLVLGDLEVAEIDSLSGAVSSILVGHLELESFILGLTAELDALSPEEVSLLGFLSFATTPSPYLAIQPAVARVVTREVADGAAHALERVEGAVDGVDEVVFVIFIAGDVPFGLDGLDLLTFDDLVDGKDNGLQVCCFVLKDLVILVAALIIPQVLFHPGA